MLLFLCNGKTILTVHSKIFLDIYSTIIAETYISHRILKIAFHGRGEILKILPFFDLLNVV